MIKRGHQTGARAVFMRGGTSNALIFREADLPKNETQRHQFFLTAMGSPDPNGRQLNGMGGGVSSLSKICIVDPSEREDADVDYTFVQIGVKDDAVDYDSACGNMTSAIGPFAVDEKLVPPPADGETMVRIFSTNTGKIIQSRFAVCDGFAEVSGSTEIIGVAGSGAGVMLDFMDPGGARGRGVLPAGGAVEVLKLEGNRTVSATMIDCGNPCVFVAAADVGLTGMESPDVIDANKQAMALLEDIRRAASVAMGLTADLEKAAEIQSVPKIAVVAAPGDYQALSGEMITAESYGIAVRMISMGQAHKAIPVTGGLSVAAAVRLGTNLVGDAFGASRDAGVKIGTPSGVLDVDAVVDLSTPQDPVIKQASLWRTTRRLMEGLVLVPNEVLET